MSICGLVATVVAAVWGVYSLLPDLIAEPGLPVLASDPYKWNILVTNKGRLPATQVTVGCAIREAEFQENFQMDAWALPTTRFDRLPIMTANQQISVLCPQYFGVFREGKSRRWMGHFSTEEDDAVGIPQGFKSVDVSSALAEINISYRVVWSIPRQEKRRLIGHRDQTGKIVWSPVGIAARLLSKPSVTRQRFTLQKCEKAGVERLQNLQPNGSIVLSVGTGFDSPPHCPE